MRSHPGPVWQGRWEGKKEGTRGRGLFNTHTHTCEKCEREKETNQRLQPGGEVNLCAQAQARRISSSNSLETDKKRSIEQRPPLLSLSSPCPPLSLSSPCPTLLLSYPSPPPLPSLFLFTLTGGAAARSATAMQAQRRRRRRRGIITVGERSSVG